MYIKYCQAQSDLYIQSQEQRVLLLIVTV